MNRYSRQLLIPEWNETAQQKIANASVAIVGVGGVGSPAALYLAAAGVGKLGLFDDDVVEIHNLQRQILYRESEIGQKKSAAAEKNLQSLNSEIDINHMPCKVTSENAQHLLSHYDIVLEGTDNFSTRFVINDVCVQLKIPFISVSVDRLYGQVSLYNYNGSKNYRDIYPSIEATYPFSKPATRGILGIVPGMAAMIAVGQILKIISGFAPIKAEHIMFDAATMCLNTFDL